MISFGSIKNSYWIGIILALIVTGYLFTQNTDHPYLGSLFANRNSENICQQTKNPELCESNPMELIKQGLRKSPSLSTIKIARYPTDINVFKPRSDVPGWEFSIPIAWDADPFKDRNWRMSLNAGRPADNCMMKYEATRDQKFFRCAYDILVDWHDFHVVKQRPNKFGWYDMSTAYRADRISKLLDWTAQDSLLSSDQIKQLIYIAMLHVENLTDPNNFNPGNHGIFQLASLERICKVVPYLKACDPAHLYVRKMIDVMTQQQFGSDGLHLEHSPGYHLFMVETYENLIQEGTLPLNHLSQSLYEQAKTSTQWLTLPNGGLPPIGDTDGLSKPVTQDTPHPTETFKLFPKGGLAVVREPKSRLWFYAFHHSNTHKQDDDLSFYLWDRGQPLLIDAGKYAYAGDPNRTYVLGRFAHNTVIIPGHVRDKKNFYGSGIQELTKTNNTYKTKGSVHYRDGISHQRSLEFNPKKSLVIHDKIEGTQKNVEINFLIAPNFTKSDQSKTKVVFKNKKQHLTISTPTLGCTLSTFRGEEKPKMRGWYSPSYKKMEPTWSVGIQCAADKEIITEISY